MRANPILTNFTSGELSPRLNGRVDVTKYFNGCQQLENFIVMPHGGVDRRPGVYFVAAAKESAKKCRLVPFEFSTTQAYILEFGHEYIRVYKDRGQVTSGSPAAPVTVTTTYTESELFDLQFAQSADTLYIAHPNHKPATLTRSSHTSWTLADITFNPVTFNSTNNYPACVAFFEQRLCWSSTNTDPQKIWASVSGDYYNLTTGTGDDDAFIYTLVSDRVNRIRWMVPSDFLFLGTVGGEFRFGGASSSDPVTPTSVNAKRQSTYGSKGVQALLIGDSVVYVQRSGKKVREMAYSLERDKYRSRDTTILAEHIAKTDDPTDTGIVNFAYQQDPDSILWAVREDGVLLGMTYEPDQQVYGWHRHTFQDGICESVAVIPGVSEDEVWVSIQWNNNRYVGYMKPRDFGVQRDAFFVDLGLTWDGGAAKVITDIDKVDNGDVTSNTYWTAAIASWSTDHWVAGDFGGYKFVDLTPGAWATGCRPDTITIEFSLGSNLDVAITGSLGSISTNVASGTPIDVTSVGDITFLQVSGTASDFNVTSIILSGLGYTVRITSASHGFSNGNKIRIQDVVGMTDVNGNTYTVANKTTNTFDLSGIDGESFDDYVSGGEVELVAASYTGALHLANKECAAYGDGGAIEDITPDGSGNFTTTGYYNTLHIGLSYDSILVPMRYEAGATLGTSQGEIQRVHRLAVKVYNSLPFQYGPSLDDLRSMPFEVNSELYSGDLSIEYDGGYDFPADTYIVQNLPNPLTILSIMPKLETVE